GFDSKISSELRRKSRIHCGSPFISEICATMSRSSPLREMNAYLSVGSWKPNWYSPTPTSGLSSISVDIFQSPTRSQPLSQCQNVLVRPLLFLFPPLQPLPRPLRWDVVPARLHSRSRECRAPSPRRAPIPPPAPPESRA